MKYFLFGVAKMSKIYVQALYDFQCVTTDGIEIKLKAGEDLLLLQKSNENWWKVIRAVEDKPFFAPSSYLAIINFCDESKKLTDYNSNFSSNINLTDEDSFIIKSSKIEIQQDSEFHENRNIQKSTSFDALPTYGKYSLQNNKLKEKQLQIEQPLNVNSNDENSKFSFVQDTLSPIYANISGCLFKLPLTPSSDKTPTRRLTNDWLEYIDEESGRRYYYHSTSGRVTWKPPRRHEHFQSTPLNSEPSSPKSSNSSKTVPNPPPKQLKPKLNKLNHSSNESLESQPVQCSFTILPEGWNEAYNFSNGTIYYYNNTSKKKWYASTDENGRTYFHDEDNSESVWELQDVSSSDDIEDLSLEKEKEADLSNEKSHSTSSGVQRLNNTIPSAQVSRQLKTRSLIVPECVNLADLQENKGYLPASFGEGYWPSIQDGHFSITRKGTLNKTKIVEGGKRIRKSWTSSFVVLTDVFLLFYKDIRSAHITNTAVKPDLCIDLNGALIEWCPEKSSRKNVFQISTVLGHQLLLQDDNAQTTKEWFDTIHAAIMMLPSSFEQGEANKEESGKKDVKLSRSKSTKHYTKKNFEDENVTVLPPEKKRKIRDKLKQFFNRRPTQESLREKGILLDEPVFGCLLENLCSRENSNVPKFVLSCIEAIEKKELTADGLYRASGNLSQVQKIRISVNQDDYSCLESEEDVHVLTGALKLFFREMKEPLFPFSLFEQFLSAIAFLDSQRKLDSFKELVQAMSRPHYETLKVLFQHLLRVTKYHKKNRMQIQNLAIVFGPTLMWPEEVSTNIALDMMHQNRIVEFLLLEYNAIFIS